MEHDSARKRNKLLTQRTAQVTQIHYAARMKSGENIHAVGFRECKIVENTSSSTVPESRPMVAWGAGRGGDRKEQRGGDKAAQETFGVTMHSLS